MLPGFPVNESRTFKGEHRVSFGDKTVEYRSVDELKAAIREVKRGILEQAAATGLWPGAPPRQIRVTTSEGVLMAWYSKIRSLFGQQPSLRYK